MGSENKIQSPRKSKSNTNCQNINQRSGTFWFREAATRKGLVSEQKRGVGLEESLFMGKMRKKIDKEQCPLET